MSVAAIRPVLVRVALVLCCGTLALVSVGCADEAMPRSDAALPPVSIPNRDRESGVQFGVLPDASWHVDAAAPAADEAWTLDATVHELGDLPLPAQRDAGGEDGATAADGGRDAAGDSDAQAAVDAIAPFTISDFDVSDDGASVAVGVLDNRLHMVCFEPGGRVMRPSFVVSGEETAGLTFSRVDVARAATSGHVVVTYHYWNWPSATRDWRNFIAFYDSRCQLVAAPRPLDAELPNTGINRYGSAYITRDGHSYVAYEHQDQRLYRVLGFDSAGVQRVNVRVDQLASGCGGGALTRALALDESSGKFALFCERQGRSFRRYSADGTPIDSEFRAVAGSLPSGFTFHFFGGALSPTGELAYFGRTSATSWLLQTYDANAQVVHSEVISGRMGRGEPRSFVTSTGNFVLELAGPDYEFLVVTPSGTVARTWPAPIEQLALDGQDSVYVTAMGNRSVARSNTLRVR